MKLKLLSTLTLGVALLSLSAFRFVQWKPTLSEDDRLKGSYKFERNGWIYVHLQGSPEQIGYQHGKLLAKEIEDLLRVVKPFLQHESKRDWDFYRKASQEILWPKIDSEFQRELDGIVKGLNDAGVKADRWDIVALNALEELPYYYLPWLEKKQGRLPTTHAPGNCSAMVATGSYTKDHRIVMGHNAWTNYIVGERWNIIFDIKPARGYRIMMDGLPGVITSDDDFGINSAGMMITETTITGFSSFDPAGSPEFYRSRKALQYSSSIDVQTVKQMESDRYDSYEKKDGPDEHSLCGCVDRSPRGTPEWDWGKFYPGGTVQAKAVDGRMAEKMQIWAAMGHPCAEDFIAETFLKAHPEYEWTRGLLRDMKTHPWSTFVADSK